MGRRKIAITSKRRQQALDEVAGAGAGVYQLLEGWRGALILVTALLLVALRIQRSDSKWLRASSEESDPLRSRETIALADSLRFSGRRRARKVIRAESALPVASPSTLASVVNGAIKAPWLIHLRADSYAAATAEADTAQPRRSATTSRGLSASPMQSSSPWPQISPWPSMEPQPRAAVLAEEAASAGLTEAEAAAAHKLPAVCESETAGRFHATLVAYGRWHAAKMAFVKAANGDLMRARVLQAAAGDTDPPLTLAVYGEPGGGWGDRVPAIVALFGLALRYGRVFLLDYHAVYNWLDSPYVDWRVDRAALPALGLAIDAVPVENRYTCQDETDETGAGCLWIYPHPDRRWPPTPPVSLHHVTNRGIWGPGSRHDHIAWFNALTGGRSACLTQAVLRPRSALLALPAVRSILARFDVAREAGMRVVGIHHRAGDIVMTREALRAAGDANAPPAAPLPDVGDVAGLDAYLTAAMGETGAATALAAHVAAGDTVLVVTDSADVREAVRRRYPAVITTDARIMHVGNDASDVFVHAAHESQRRVRISEDVGMRDVLVDWWLLASTDLRKGLLLSGFVRSATVASATGAFDQGTACMNEFECCAGDHATITTCFVPIGSGS